MGEPLKIDQDVLRHHGIRGMHWGVRRGHNRGPGHEQHEETKTLLKKGSKNLSNEELAKVNKRLQLEKTYTELTAKKKKKARISIGGVLTGAKTAEQFYNLATGPMGKEVRANSKQVKKFEEALRSAASRSHL